MRGLRLPTAHSDVAPLIPRARPPLDNPVATGMDGRTLDGQTAGAGPRDGRPNGRTDHTQLLWGRRPPAPRCRLRRRPQRRKLNPTCCAAQFGRAWPSRLGQHVAEFRPGRIGMVRHGGCGHHANPKPLLLLAAGPLEEASVATEVWSRAWATPPRKCWACNTKELWHPKHNNYDAVNTPGWSTPLSISLRCMQLLSSRDTDLSCRANHIAEPSNALEA